MVKAERRANRVREQAAPYAAVPSGFVVMPWSVLEAAERHMEQLKEKARMVGGALRKAGIPYAVMGGFAVAEHTAKVDEWAVRGTRDVDLRLNRADSERAAQALRPLGYNLGELMGLPAFVRPRGAGVRSRLPEAMRLVWAGERTRSEDLCLAPSLATAGMLLSPDGYACLDVAGLLTMKLTSFRVKDQVHIQGLLTLGMVTRAMRKALPPVLLARLKQVEEITRREESA